MLAVDLDGRAEVVAQGPGGFGWSIAWLPDGSLLTTGPETTLHTPDGSRTTWSERGGNEIVVDPSGRVYVDGGDFEVDDALFAAGTANGSIHLLAADGSAREVATGIAFPNGMVVTPDGSTLVVAESFAGRLSAFTIQPDGGLTGRRVWAEGLGPDGIAIDADAGIWAQSADTFSGASGSSAGVVVRVLDGGEITHRVQTPLPCFSCTIGGPEGRHLFLLCNEWEGIEKAEAVLARRSALVLVTELP